MFKRILCLVALILTVALLLIHLPEGTNVLPGTRENERQLLRVWTLSSVGGGQAWLKAALKRYEKQHPGVMTYLRQARPEDLTAEGAVLPDLVLYMPGDLQSGELFVPLTGEMQAEEALLRCGRWRGSQVGLPLCWAGYVLAVSAELEPENALTPEPTTLLGRPALTAAPFATATPGYPAQAALAAAEALQCPRGAGFFSLAMLLKADVRPNVPESFGTLDSAAVYQRYRTGQCASALLTTGQAVALDGLILEGQASSSRYLVPDEVITEQVWLGSIPSGSGDGAADLLAYLTSQEAQKLLANQGLQPVSASLRLYAGGANAEIARAAQRGLTAINAFADPQKVAQGAWQVYQGSMTMNDALLPVI